MQTTPKKHYRYWKAIWEQFCHSKTGVAALAVVVLFAVVGIYAPFLANSKPFAVFYDGHLYFPLFRYLFYTGFYTKPLDIFYNLLMLAIPLWICLAFLLPIKQRILSLLMIGGILTLYLFLLMRAPNDPGSDPVLNQKRQNAVQEILQKNLWTDEGLLAPPEALSDWNFELQFMTPYAKLNETLRYKQRLEQHQHLKKYEERFLEREIGEWLDNALIREKEKLRANGVAESDWPSPSAMKQQIIEETSDAELKERIAMPTLWQVDRWNEEREIRSLQEKVKKLETDYQTALKSLPELQTQYKNILRDSQAAPDEKQKTRGALLKMRQSIFFYQEANARLAIKVQRQQWLQEQLGKIAFTFNPLIRSFHWEDDAGGEQDLNRYIDWWDLTRINRKDLVAGLLFGIRVSLFVGITSVLLALSIGLPIGAAAGYYAGTTDIIVCRLLEIWESMPVFFMLLMVVAITQSKSIFLVIAVIGTFGWTGFSRFLRGEFFKQRNLPYVDACRAMGYGDRKIIFSQILPNALPPILTLLPFAIMGAITSEAGLSFLGLGEEGSCSWGVLMDEGRNAFPGESYLLWPPAILLTVLLVAIALVGDAMRDAIDPKLRR